MLKELGANVIRTYAIDPTQDHSVCMGLLDEAGIYVISDLGEPNLSINRESPSWNLQLYDRYTSVIDDLSQYTNVIGFFAGNEVTNNASYTPASAFVKAAVRDTKAYIKSKGYTAGVGYAADDDAGVRAQVSAYFVVRSFGLRYFSLPATHGRICQLQCPSLLRGIRLQHWCS
jgi:hypothetical protein